MPLGGRLIFPKTVEIRRLDTGAAFDAGDYDRKMREPFVSNRNINTERRVLPRRETPIRLSAQIETEAFQRMQMGGIGHLPSSTLVCVFHGKELEENGLIDTTTRMPLLKPTDRLEAVFEYKTDRIVFVPPNPPGFFATHVQPTGFGFGSGGYNLVEVTFEARAQGATSGGL